MLPDWLHGEILQSLRNMNERCSSSLRSGIKTTSLLWSVLMSVFLLRCPVAVKHAHTDMCVLRSSTWPHGLFSGSISTAGATLEVTCAPLSAA